MSARTALWVDAAVKLATVGLLAVAVIAADLPQFQGKAFAGRAIAYPIALAAVPVAWWVFGRGRVAYPILTDLYDTIEWWDEANHLANWALHTAAIALVVRRRVPPLTVVAVGVAWASTTAILWELAEYVAFVPNSPEAATAYADTLGDLVLGLLGGTIAALLIAWRASAPRRLTTRATAPNAAAVAPAGDGR